MKSDISDNPEHAGAGSLIHLRDSIEPMLFRPDWNGDDDIRPRGLNPGFDWNPGHITEIVLVLGAIRFAGNGCERDRKLSRRRARDGANPDARRNHNAEAPSNA